jgi:hypothetical protein
MPNAIETCFTNHPLGNYNVIYYDDYSVTFRINDVTIVCIGVDKFVSIIHAGNQVFHDLIWDMEDDDDYIRLINEVKGYYDHYQSETIVQYIDNRFYVGN